MTFALSQNYPNPFNPVTSITYEIAAAANVTLTVFDILGRQVRTIVNEREQAGVHTAHLDASGLASGVYLYRVTAGTFVATRQMVLVK